MLIKNHQNKDDTGMNFKYSVNDCRQDILTACLPGMESLRSPMWGFAIQTRPLINKQNTQFNKEKECL